MKDSAAAGYAKSGVAVGYQGWPIVNSSPYASGTHGGRYVNNYVDPANAAQYARYEGAGVMPVGTILAKDSFGAKADGSVSYGPLFLMEKMDGGFNATSADWKYTMVMPNGSVVGETNGKGSKKVQFCIGCHAAAAANDQMFFLPAKYRK